MEFPAPPTSSLHQDEGKPLAVEFIDACESEFGKAGLIVGSITGRPGSSSNGVACAITTYQAGEMRR
jgi:hypothetical protein